MLLLAEYVPATMLDPKALGTAFDVKKNKKVRMELHILTFIEQCSGLQGRRRCLAAGVLDIWHGTDPPDLGTARHGTSLFQLESLKKKKTGIRGTPSQEKTTSSSTPVSQGGLPEIPGVICAEMIEGLEQC